MRRWLVAVVVILVGAGACRGGRQTASSRAGGDPLALLPSETRVVISVDLVRARQAPIAAQLAAFRPLLAGPLAAIDTFTAKTGFDPWRDIHSIVLARSNSPDQWGLIVRGALLTNSASKLTCAASRKKRATSSRRSGDC